MKLLVIGHSLVIDSNRKFWSVFARKTGAMVDLVAPENWSSNLTSDLSFQGNPETDSGIRRIHPVRTFFRGNGSLHFHAPWSLMKILFGQSYDAIYINQETWALSTFLILFLKMLSPNRKSKVFLCVAQNLKKEKYKFLHPYERFISHFIDSFLYCSEGVKEVLQWKGIRRNFIYFPLPYDNESYTPASVAPVSPTFKLGYLGRISEEKGIKVLLSACDKLHEEKFPFHLIMGGNGPLVEEIKKRKYVTYLGLIPHNEAHHFYKKIDCFILPSQTTTHWIEQFGRVIVEAFGAGKPVIGSSSGSVPEVLSKLQWEWVFKEDSSEELATKIKMLKTFLGTNEGSTTLKRSIQLNSELFSQFKVAQALHNELFRRI